MKKCLASLLCLSLIFCVVGCKKTKNTAEDINTDVEFPITDREVELSYWSPLNSKVTAFATSLSAVLSYQELEKATGIKIDFQHPPVGQENEQFNLMMASKTLPDIIYHAWGNITGGVDAFVEEGTILKLNDYMDTLAPNYKKLLDENPQAKLETQTDSGDIYMFPFLRTDEKLRFYKGLLVREDWLTKLSLSVPETPEEFYNVLKAFKTNDLNGNGQADEIPLVSKKMEAIETIINGFGASSDYILKDGKVLYGPMQPEYREALTFVKKLFDEGLIDPDFYLTDDNSMDAKVISNQAGIMYGAITGHMSKYMSMMKAQTPDVSIAAMPSMRAADGRVYIFNKLLTRCSTGNGAVITKDNKYIAESVKLLDYFYSENGHMTANFGVLGDTYNMVDGVPVYADKIMKNDSGSAIGDILSQYVLAPTSGAFLQDPRYFDQILIYPQQKEAPGIWSKDIVTDRIVPATSLTSDEHINYSALNGDISTYKDEMTNKFVIGTEDLGKFDDFIDQLKKLGIENAIAVQQSAYDRYLGRK